MRAVLVLVSLAAGYVAAQDFGTVAACGVSFPIFVAGFLPLFFYLHLHPSQSIVVQLGRAC